MGEFLHEEYQESPEQREVFNQKKESSLEAVYRGFVQGTITEEEAINSLKEIEENYVSDEFAVMLGKEKQKFEGAIEKLPEKQWMDALSEHLLKISQENLTTKGNRRFAHSYIARHLLFSPHFIEELD